MFQKKMLSIGLMTVGVCWLHSHYKARRRFHQWRDLTVKPLLPFLGTLDEQMLDLLLDPDNPELAKLLAPLAATGISPAHACASGPVLIEHSLRRPLEALPSLSDWLRSRLASSSTASPLPSPPFCWHAKFQCPVDVTRENLPPRRVLLEAQLRLRLLAINAPLPPSIQLRLQEGASEGPNVEGSSSESSSDRAVVEKEIGEGEMAEKMLRSLVGGDDDEERDRLTNAVMELRWESVLVDGNPLWQRASAAEAVSFLRVCWHDESLSSEEYLLDEPVCVEPRAGMGEALETPLGVYFFLEAVC